MSLAEVVYQPGDVCLTLYGVGVIVAASSAIEDANADVVSFYSVRLWRIPGKSVGSASLAKLQAAAVRLNVPYRTCV
jgi:hypothetical protein